MKKEKEISSGTYHAYDLSSPHFQHTEIVTKNNISIQGQFVRFKVTENSKGFRIYPSEKLCFLPFAHKKKFWRDYEQNNGEFSQFPPFVQEFGLDEIRQIIISPVLIA